MNHDTFDVYVPAPGARSWAVPKSGIVGTREHPRIVLDFEGAVHGQSSMRTYADRLHHAAGRHDDRYPTSARVLVGDEDAIRVGTYHYRHGRFEPEDGLALVQVAKWLDLVTYGDPVPGVERMIEGIESGQLAIEFRVSDPHTTPHAREVNQRAVAASRSGDAVGFERAAAEWRELGA